MNLPSLVIAITALFLATSVSAEQPFGIDHYLALKYVSGIAVSPDDAFVAYTESATDLEKDNWGDSVWLQPTAGGAPLRMSSSESSAGSPQWSPDGRYLAILSDRKDDTSQVWLYDRRGGDAQQLTKLPQGVDDYAWAPDSKRLLLVVEDATPADLDEEERPNPRPYVVDRLQFKEDYVGYLDRYRTHIHVIDLEDRTPRQVTSGDFEDSEPAWAPDSQRIVFVSNRTDDADSNRNTDLWIVDSSKENSKPRQLTTSETADASPAWSPDGRTIVYTSTDAEPLPIYALPRLTTIDVGSGKVTVIAALDETQVFYPRFAPDGNSVYAVTEDHAEQNLVRVELQSGAVRSLIEGSDIVSEYSIGQDGSIYAMVSRPDLPGQIFALDGGRLQQLSHINEELLADVKLARTEKHSYQSPDGTKLETLVMFPPEFRKGRKSPGLLFVHGGPQAQWDFRFDAEAQILAAQGYVLVMPNPRGSFGYGQAFAEAIYQDWGGVDYEDVIAAMDFAIDEGWVDEARTAVYGWSYGGMMTNHVITKTDRFKAAITGASATLYMANYGHDQYQRWWEEELGLPWIAENREKWDRISPFFSLGNVKTPTLIVGGEDDWNVPIMNSEQLFIALKRQGVPTELVVYPNEGHVLSVPSYEKDLFGRYIAWLERYVIGKK